MHPRQSLIDLFSTFLQFDAERFSGWVTESKLRRSMQNCLAKLQESEREENFWALYWHKLWQSQSATLARSHLIAYLQEPCYWASHKITQTRTSNQYPLSDCFQIAIASIDTVLKGFKSTQGFHFKNYASVIFSSVLRNELRQRQEIDICTDYALLRKLSQKRLIESLQSAGFSEEKIASYVLAWNCFKILYAPAIATKTRKLPPPSRETWEAIATLYNQQRTSQLSPSIPTLSAATLEKHLLACAKAARNYLYPNVVSLNVSKPGQEADEFLDSLPESATESLLVEMIAQEEQQNRAAQLSQMNAILTAAIAKLDREAQTIVLLYYGQDLTQQQIAQQLGIKQYAVSRRLTKARESLLLALAQWSRDTLHIFLSSDVLKDISIVLEGWLKNAEFNWEHLTFA